MHNGSDSDTELIQKQLKLRIDLCISYVMCLVHLTESLQS